MKTNKALTIISAGLLMTSSAMAFNLDISKELLSASGKIKNDLRIHKPFEYGITGPKGCVIPHESTKKLLKLLEPVGPIVVKPITPLKPIKPIKRKSPAKKLEKAVKEAIKKLPKLPTIKW